MMEITVLGTRLKLLPEKAIYVESLNSLLVSDVHLGKSETFQSLGVPIPNQVNQETLDRLEKLCTQFAPENLIILGDLFHSNYALVAEVLEPWSNFVESIPSKVQFLVGNHDRRLMTQLKQLSIECLTEALQFENLLLSHEPCVGDEYLNVCGHIHPCVQIKTRLDQIRLPCFYLDRTQNLLILPSFGAFTGGHNVQLKRGAIAYAIAEDSIIAFDG